MFKEERSKLRNAVFGLTWAKIGKVPVKIGGHTKWMFDVWTVVLRACCRHSRTASEPQNFVTVTSVLRHHVVKVASSELNLRYRKSERFLVLTNAHRVERLLSSSCG